MTAKERDLVIGLLLHLVTLIACLVGLGLAAAAFLEYARTDDVSSGTALRFACALGVAGLLNELARRWR